MDEIIVEQEFVLTSEEPAAATEVEYRPDYSMSSPYLRDLIDPKHLAAIVQVAARCLAKYEYDAIAVRGVSGLLLGPALAIATGKSLIVVRKEESAHAKTGVEGDIAARRYIIVDDFVDTGETCRTIVSKIENLMPQVECLGSLACSTLFIYENDPLFDRHLSKSWMQEGD
jgi:adenine/guanine phosphoribosyltransferase-like PRPP-binding protein